MRAPAVVFPAPDRVEIRSMELPSVGPTDVGVRTVCSGVSQGTERWLLTNRHRWTGGVPQNPYFLGYQAATVRGDAGPTLDELARPGDAPAGSGGRSPVFGGAH